MHNTITIPKITLEWSDWYSWNRLKKDAREENGIKIPNQSGVYEVKRRRRESLQYIGKASNLRMRVRQGLIKGKVPHSGGKKIRKNEDVSKLIVRWAVTKRPSCVEEELHQKYIKKFGKSPKHVDHTT